MIGNEYFREYRKKLGFSNQNDAKSFFCAKNVVPGVDFSYIEMLNKRLSLITEKINSIVHINIKQPNIDSFKKDVIEESYNIIKKSNILPRLNNQGRRPEQVYFSWMRGYIFTEFFTNALAFIFSINPDLIKSIGDDDLKKIETFQRTPKADLELIQSDGKKIRIEMQTGFTGMNDIKQHKVLEAKKILETQGVDTLDLHFDLYNGQVAFVLLSRITEDSVNWITRQQMEGQTVFNIDQNLFLWKLTDLPPKYEEIKKALIE